MAHVLAKDLRSSVIKAAISGELTEADNVHDFVINTVSDDLVPFEIKDNWGWASFDDVFSFKGGFAFKSSNYIKDSSNQVIRLGNVKNNLLITEEKQVFINDNDAKLAEKYKIQKNDILITMTGTRGKKDYLFSVLINEWHLKRNLYLNQRVGCFRCKENILPEYAIIVLKCEEILNLVFDHETGTANQGNIGTAEFKKYLYIPLPPIEEQARIVARVDELMAKIDEYEKLENELVELKKNFPGDMKAAVLQAAMQGKLTEQLESDSNAFALAESIKNERKVLGKNKYVTDSFNELDIPETWTTIKSGECFSLEKGEKVSGVNLPYLEAKYLRGKISATMMSSGEFVSKGTEVILVDGENSGEIFIEPEDGIIGSTFKILFIPKSIDKNYALYFLSMNRDLFRNNKKGSAIPHLSKEIFNDLTMPIPPIEEQRRIVEKIDQLLPLCEELANLC